MAQRRSKGDGGVSQRSDGKWLAQIELGYDVNGRRKKKSRVAKNKTEAIKLLKYLQLEKQKNMFTLQGNMMFGDFLERWLAVKRGQLKPKSYMDYERICKGPVVAKLGKFKMEKIGTNVINDFLQEQLKRGIGASTVSKYKALLSGIFSMAVAEHIIVGNPAQSSIRIKKVRPQTKYIREEDMKRILRAASDITKIAIAGKRQDSNLRCVYPIVLTAYQTGMRINEILALRWENVDLESRVLKVRENLSEAKDAEGKIRVLVGDPKTAESRRDISISQTLTEVLKELRCEQVSADMVFTSKTGGYITASNFSRVWRKLLLKLALKGEYRFHDIRHTHATELISKGFNIKSVAARLGHADVQTTLNIYAHALPRQDQDIAMYFDE